jgi:hypothetical protein
MKATSILSWKFVKECSVGKTNADVKISLLSLKSKGAELKKMDSNDRVISIYRPRHRKRLPIARKFSAIWGTLMVSKKN